MVGCSEGRRGGRCLTGNKGTVLLVLFLIGKEREKEAEKSEK